MEVGLICRNSYKEFDETIILAYYEDMDKTEDLFYLDEQIRSMVKHLVEADEFKGKHGEVQSFRVAREVNPRIVVLLGLGKREELCTERLRRAVAKAVKECKKLRAKSVGMYPVGLPSGILLRDSARVIIEGVLMADYKFDKYKSDKKESTIYKFTLVYEKEEGMDEVRAGIEEGRILAEATLEARWLVNEPANMLGPSELADEAERLGRESGFLVQVYDEDGIEELGMKAFMEVSRGSDNPPRFIVMSYLGDPENKDEVLGLVGKGLTYDSGGLSLKPTDGMVTMKCDMGGAATVMGAMSAIARRKLSINVVAVVAACENMISGRSYKPGDIIGSMGGKTIEVLNTDAEGRLTLVDAVHYIIEREGATRVVDAATLTGAALVALGTTTTAVVSNNDDFFQQLNEAAGRSGEKMWRLPDYDDYKELIKSEVADLKNIGGRHAGTITAALFIGEFVQKKPWIHLDIAGTAWSDKEDGYLSKGGTGAGVRTLYHLAELLSK